MDSCNILRQMDPANVHPGVYRGIDYNEYASWQAVRASTLNACMKSLAHGRESELNPRPDTKALAFGTLFHTLILEPDKFNDRYAIAPNLDKRTVDGKLAWARFADDCLGKSSALARDVRVATEMRDGIFKCRDAASLINGARSKELSLVWRDQETNILCKGRIDLLSVLYNRTYIVDLKSTSDASKYAFRKQSESLGYYRSMAFYRWGLNCLFPSNRRCAIIAVEKDPPYAVAVYELTENALIHGMDDMRLMLNKYAEAMRTSNWPAYGDDIHDMDLSTYLQKNVGFN